MTTPPLDWSNIISNNNGLPSVVSLRVCVLRHTQRECVRQVETDCWGDPLPCQSDALCWERSHLQLNLLLKQLRNPRQVEHTQTLLCTRVDVTLEAQKQTAVKKNPTTRLHGEAVPPGVLTLSGINTGWPGLICFRTLRLLGSCGRRWFRSPSWIFPGSPASSSTSSFLCGSIMQKWKPTFPVFFKVISASASRLSSCEDVMRKQNVYCLSAVMATGLTGPRLSPVFSW